MTYQILYADIAIQDINCPVNTLYLRCMTIITFGNRLKNLRVEKKLTQKDFAKHFGFSERQLRRYENDEFEPSMKTLIAIADYFDVSLDYLVGRSDNPKRK